MSLEYRPKILLVDDHPENLEVLYRALRDEYDLYSATSGPRALATARKRRPDLILLDIMMPEMDGYEVCRRLKESETLRNVPVIFLTALSDDADELAGFALGAVDYITKPYKPAIVKQRVATQLALQRQTELLARSNDELQTALNRLRLANDAANIGVWSWNCVDDLIEWDERTSACYDTPEEVRSRGITYDFWLSRVHPGDRAEILLLLLTARNEGISFAREFRLSLPDESTRFVHVACVVEHDAQGVPVRLIGINRDITARKQTEIMLRTLSMAIEQGPVSVVITDLDTTIRYVNPVFSTVTGYTAAEAVGRQAGFVKSGITENAVYADMWHHLLQGRPWSGEFLNKRRNGELFYEEAYIAPVCDSHNVPTRYVAVKVDVSERKRYEQELREAHDKVSEAYEVIREDLEVAARIQGDLIPQKIVTYNDLTFDWLFSPSQFVAGDIFNVLRLDENHVAYYLLDVSGHGIPAALLSSTLSGLLKPSPDFSGPLRRSLPDPPYYEITSPGNVARLLNERFLSDGEQIQYFTMVYGTVDIRTGEGALTQAGHPSPIHQKADGSVRLIGEGGFPIGLVPEVDYDEHPLSLLPGERLFLYSDGITECTNPDGAMFGDERLLEIIRSGHGEPLRTAIRRIEAELAAFRGGSGYVDDISLLALERQGNSGGALP